MFRPDAPEKGLEESYRLTPQEHELLTPAMISTAPRVVSRQIRSSDHPHPWIAGSP